ncbi:biotin--[acetyl-CoA-carboxylase] ligase [Nocardioides sp. GY 10127]|uniref:biotin--[acetyl-CoA-carboxylase] ligase n=1 Tax=Nocardioides sp. GY 10127 TaxID=2569762 RepID=UPI0010A8AC15|nr:biotin--[acetyl-CoA-carboxylase] ligase [Nocardioides sp. GY 10127]TIC84253.1 biotin--[acetyl-CoA-carboxylase] ligase [Nocardioides sp. GY 10127]
MDPDALASLLPLGVRAEVLPTSPSTNAEAAARARAGEPGPLVLVAEHQTAGRGRLDRAWTTPAGTALTFSLLVRLAVPVQHWPWLPLLVGTAVSDALAGLGHPARLKWPNDVLLPVEGETRKVAGILAERVDAPVGAPAAAVLGVGLNVGLAPDELPVPTATSLLVEASARAGEGEEPDVVDRTHVLGALVPALTAALASWEAAGGDDPGLRERYAARCSTLGQDVRVSLPDGSALLGQAVGIDEHGRLLVSGSDGVVPVGAGDVVHVRPA